MVNKRTCTVKLTRHRAVRYLLQKEIGICLLKCQIKNKRHNSVRTCRKNHAEIQACKNKHDAIHISNFS